MTTTQTEYLERWKEKQKEYSQKSSHLETRQRERAEFALSKFAEAFEMSPAWDEVSWERFIGIVDARLSKYGVAIEKAYFSAPNSRKTPTNA